MNLIKFGKTKAATIRKIPRNCYFYNSVSKWFGQEMRILFEILKKGFEQQI